MPSSRGSSPPRDRTQVSRIAGRFLTISATGEALGSTNTVPNPAPSLGRTLTPEVTDDPEGGQVEGGQHPRPLQPPHVLQALHELQPFALGPGT